TLDDDCLPDDYRSLQAVSLTRRHLWALGPKRWASSVPKLAVRGLPASPVGLMANVVANVGLWTGVPDLPGHAQAAGQTVPDDWKPPEGNWLLPVDQYAPICGMNLFITDRALPLFYFPLQGDGQPYHRFDDIWAGVIAKRICDLLGWTISIGEPWVNH